MNDALHGKVVLVVGGTAGIGLAAAHAFVRRGARVVVAARNEQRGTAALQSLRTHGDASFHPCNVNDDASVAALVAWVLRQHGALHCAVNSAASDWQPGPAHAASSDDARHVVGTDTIGLFHCMKHEVEAMLAHGGGTIVNVASVNGLSGTPGAALYSAAKHAVVGLTRSMAKELIGQGIRINAVSPGATDTERRARRTAHLDPAEQAEQRQRVAQAIPIGRLARADEIANAIVWLSAPESSYVVGHNLVVDGGLAA